MIYHMYYPVKLRVRNNKQDTVWRGFTMISVIHFHYVAKVSIFTYVCYIGFNDSHKQNFYRYKNLVSHLFLPPEPASQCTLPEKMTKNISGINKSARMHTTTIIITITVQ